MSNNNDNADNTNNADNPLLLVSPNIKDVEIILNSCTNVSDYLLYSDSINSSNLSKTYYRFGLMYVNTLASKIPFFNDNNSPVSSISPPSISPNGYTYIFFSQDLIQFIKSTGCKVLDLITCSITNLSLINEIKALSNDLSITINYSINKTGNVAEGGDWNMEESVINGNINANQLDNIKPIYFNDNINNWDFLLDDSSIAPTVTVLTDNHIKSTLNADGISHTYKLTKSIYINNKNNPVLTLNNGDIFDGNHHTITMKYDTIGILYCSGITPDGVTATEAIIKDLKVICPNVSDVDNNLYYLSGGGIICATSSYFSVYNCHIDIKNNIEPYAGGICGQDCNHINNLSNCKVNVGSIGYYGGGIYGTHCYTITNTCHCEVNIKDNIGSYAGGICGNTCQNVIKLSKCKVNVDGNIETYSGGIFASYCQTLNTTCDCKVNIGGDIESYSGGICGYQCNNITTLSECDVDIGGNINSYSGGICGKFCYIIFTLSYCKVNIKGNIQSNGSGICGELCYNVTNLKQMLKVI